MQPSIFTDELALDITKALPIIQAWGLSCVDLRGRVLGKAFESLPAERLPELRKLLDDHGMSVGCLESSLAKVHLPDADRQASEAGKLEGIIRAADALDCQLVRSFFYWQPPDEMKGALAVRPDEQQKVLDLFGPLAERAQAAGLVLAFENCGVTPDEVFTVLDMLDEPSWGLAWDVCNTWSSDERRADEGAFLIRMAQRARLVHVKARGAVKGTAEIDYSCIQLPEWANEIPASTVQVGGLLGDDGKLVLLSGGCTTALCVVLSLDGQGTDDDGDGLMDTYAGAWGYTILLAGVQPFGVTGTFEVAVAP